MTPEEAIADLDAKLAEDGASVSLVRPGQGAQGQEVPVSVTLRAIIRVQSRTPTEIVPGVKDQAFTFVMSPTEITAAAWPGPSVGIPSQSMKDYFLSAGKKLRIQACTPIYFGTTLVRLDGMAVG